MCLVFKLGNIIRQCQIPFVNKIGYTCCVRVLVNLENHQTRIKLIFAYLKHSLLVGVRRCLDSFRP